MSNVEDAVLRQVVLLLTGIFFTTWLTYGYALNRNPKAGSRFAVSNLLIGAGVWVVSQRSGQSNFIDYQIADWMVVCGLTFFWSGVQRVIYPDVRAKWITWLPLAVEILATAWLAPDPTSYVARAMPFNLVCSAIAMGTFFDLSYGSSSPNLNRWKKLEIGWPFPMAGLIFFARGIQILTRAIQSTNQLQDPTGGFSVFLWVFIAILTFINLSTLMLVVGELLSQLQDLTDLDHLTGVYNRRFLDKLLRSEHGRFQRYGHPLSCLVIDIDHFKNVNDSHGHDVGDLALQHICKTFEKCLRLSDTFARYGGEEFCLLCPDTDLNLAAEVAERLRHALEDSVLSANGIAIRLTASFGVSTLRDGESPEALLKRADQAVYQAKQSGRNRVQVDRAA